MSGIARILEAHPVLGRLLQQLASSPHDPAVLAALAIQLEQRIMVEEAAAIHEVHPSTFKRHYGHLIESLGPRCQRVKLRDAINPRPAQARPR